MSKQSEKGEVEQVIQLGIPQIIYLALSLVSVGIAITVHGEPKTGNHDALVTIISTVMMYTLLYWGGFFG